MGKIIQQSNHILSRSCLLWEIFLFLILKNWPQRMFHGYMIQSWLIGTIVPYSGNWNKIKVFCTKIFHFIFKCSCFIYPYVDYNSHFRPLPHWILSKQLINVTNDLKTMVEQSSITIFCKLDYFQYILDGLPIFQIENFEPFNELYESYGFSSSQRLLNEEVQYS